MGRRPRMGPVTPRGKSVITPIFRQHVAAMEKVFAGLSCEEMRQLERQLKRIGRQAESLLDPVQSVVHASRRRRAKTG
jgi:DNA-binding MarR family transcriptional regulator